MEDLIKSPVTIRHKYGSDLNQSLDALCNAKEDTAKEDTTAMENEPAPKDLMQIMQRLASQAGRLFATLVNHMKSRDEFDLLDTGDLWPRITPLALLRCIASTSGVEFGLNMRNSLIEYGLGITSLQRAKRIAASLSDKDIHRLSSELGNHGHTNWSPKDRPDWLLLEIETDVTIREDQVNVALATISPASGTNSLLQMRMGAGKSSLIIPMAAAVLADVRSLCRIIVPSPLLLQMAQLLQSRLGGLLGRSIKHVPFARRTSTRPETTKLFHSIHQRIMEHSGVMLCLPEHLLSFMLSGQQRLADRRISEAVSMIGVQHWLEQTSRDVLDESDFTLAVRTQLIYPSGAQSVVDGHPHRWKTVQIVLQMFADLTFKLQKDFPTGIEVIRRPDAAFPAVFFLQREVEDAAISRLTKSLCAGQASLLPVKDLSAQDSRALERFISRAVCSGQDVALVEALFLDTDVAMQNVLLLRGLLVHRLLMMTLNKRVNVNYGLHPNRDPIAVPFHSKGVPSEQAEWGHPDVAILLTCLSFYYDGLRETQIRQTLEHVLRSDDPGAEYDRWAQDSADLPAALRSWNAINLDDEVQSHEIWKHLRFTKVVVDYFLNNFVFPKYAKQFETQLRASGWDIPLMGSVPSHRRTSQKENPAVSSGGEMCIEDHT